MRRDKCPICKSKSKTIIKKIRLTIPEYFHLPDNYDVVVCEECGFCYAATKATLEDYDYYYTHCNSYSGMPTESAGKRKFNQRAVELVSFVDKDKMIMDIGCGKGNLMRLLREQGFRNVFGMDPSSDSVIQMQQEGFTVFKGSIFDEVRADLKGNFDCIFLFDVLEHLLYPDLAIEKVSGYLKEDGYLLISVPNYAALFENYTMLANQFNQEHINYFSVTSLDNLLQSKNFYRVDDENIRKQEIVDSAELLVVYRHCSEGILNKLNYPIKDEICKKSIETYIQRNNESEQEINNKLTQFDTDSVYVWGTGAYVMWLLSNTEMSNMNIEAFIDNNPVKVGKEFFGKPTINIEKISRDIPILICCMRYSQEIADQIKAAHLSNAYLIL